MGPRPLKEFGQHFLLDEDAAAKIVDSMHLRWEDRALEIGPGRGVLLRFLLKQSHRVTALELDRRLEKMLNVTFGGHPGLDLVFDDFMKFDLVGYILSQTSAVKIVGNIPYSLSSSILFRLFEAAAKLQEMGSSQLESAVIMLQREVAQRICAPPGSRIYGGITVFRALVADAELLFKLPPESFHPAPKVTSAVVLIKFYRQSKYSVSDAFYFSQLVHHVFTQRRKMLRNSLASLSWIRRDWAGIDFDLTHRPEDLDVEQFIKLFQLVYSDKLNERI
ncbi:MAG: 16S rRNA (adenine(1518)-N(6)/adenine(1519)-N(6))-dimethyltransferase RsmA [bacterium]|nr:16S rRNA (adenine(1518)-N(6)/adenine(1519)-N(6))-dimethyltransferase RsmA [bacterium]